MRATLDFATFEPPLPCSEPLDTCTLTGGRSRDASPAELHLHKTSRLTGPHCMCVWSMRASCSYAARAQTLTRRSPKSSPSATEPRLAALAKPGRVRRARASGLGHGQLHRAPPASAASLYTAYRESDDPWKRTYSRMAVSCRPALPLAASKMHTASNAH